MTTEYASMRWDLDKDVLRGRDFDFSSDFLPDGLSLLSRLPFLGERDRRRLSQIQGRTYANAFGLLEHEACFRRVEGMIAAGMPEGYAFVARPDDVAALVLGKSTWAVLALTCHIELATQVHYQKAIQPDATLSPVYKDVFLYHWKEESQHAALDERAWQRVNEPLTPAERDQALDDFLALIGAADGLLRAQAAADVAYFRSIAENRYRSSQIEQLREGVLLAYRWQYIVSGVQHPRFLELLLGMITPEQAERVTRALAAIVGGGGR